MARHAVLALGQRQVSHGGYAGGCRYQREKGSFHSSSFQLDLNRHDIWRM
jgi:hypothetical protein